MAFENPWTDFIYKPFPGKVLNSSHVILEYKIPFMVIMRMKTIMGNWNPIPGIYSKNIYGKTAKSILVTLKCKIPLMVIIRW